MERAASAAPTRRSWLLRNPADWRQIGIITVYYSILGSMWAIPACRNVFFLGAAFYFAFLNGVVIHNCLHQGIFHSQRLNLWWRIWLSFGVLYPASANIPSHNLVHHHFDDEGQLDWADPSHVSFRWNLLNLIHFPNVAGPNTFFGIQRWMQLKGKAAFRAQYMREQVFAFGVTAILLAFDFWGTLFFIVLPQLYGARGMLRINLIQHDGCDTSSEWNHSRNFVGRAFNWIMCNNGLHTIHHNRAGVHWSDLMERHQAEVVPRIDPSLNEPSMLGYLLRTYLLRPLRPAPRSVASAEAAAPVIELAPRELRRAEAEREGDAELAEPLAVAEAEQA
jgi:fatty acid desaturase